MNLFLIRHSIAERASFNKKDFERELTQEGKTLLEKSVMFWKYYIEEFDIILSSPLKRAIQTSDIISKYFQNTKNVIIENNLGTGSKTSDLIDMLSSNEKENVAIVGHQPDLSIHIFNLCGNGQLNLSFPPATIAKIEFESRIRYGSGSLEFFLPPVTKL